MRADVVLAGKYRLLKQIGAGGMGAVWLARNEMTEREFAIKLLRPIALADPKAVARFIQEARVTAKLRHPSLLEIFDVGVAEELDGAPYLVMELLDGATLDRVVRKVGPLDVSLVLDVMGSVSHALALAHDRGIIHRDIKPANVFLHRPGTGAVTTKVLDFGISKMMATPELEPSLGLTQTGSILGSPLYMSPEQLEGDRSLDARSDVHAIGVLMWECLVGRAPFVATNYNLLVVEVLNDARPKLELARPEVPREVQAIVARAMSRRREARYASAREMAIAIDDARKALGIGHVLDARTSAERLFERILVPSAAPAPTELTASSLVASTTGAVSVPSVGRTLESARGSGSASSPRSYMLRSDHDASPLARTEMASADSVPKPATSQAVTADDTKRAALPRIPPTPSRAPKIGIAAAGVILLASGAWWLRAQTSKPVEAITPSIVDAAPAALPSASVTVVTITPDAGPTAPIASTPPAPSAIPTPVATTTARPGHHGHAPPATAATATAKPAANRGIVSDGL